MALLTTGSLTNVYLSLNAFFEMTLTDTLGLALHAHGARRFVPPETAHWAQLDYSLLTLERDYKRQVGGDVYGTEVVGPVDLHVYRHARVWTTNYLADLVAVRDQIVAAIPEPSWIPIRDYAAFLTPIVASIYVESLDERLLDSGHDSGLVHWLLTFYLRYLEERT